MADRKPRAFLSYVRVVDKHEGGAISLLRERLEGELQVLTGEAFPIFQDWQDIGWGQDWRRRLAEALDEVVFLVPLLTEGYFRSAACQEELELFAARERKLARDDLILPCSIRHAHPLNGARTNRSSVSFGPAIGRLGSTCATSLRPLRPIAKPSRGSRGSWSRHSIDFRQRSQPVREVADSAGDSSSEASELAVASNLSLNAAPAALRDPPITHVDAWGRGQFTDLAEAVNAAEPGSQILVYPGYYEGALVIDKPLEILGQGDASEIVVRARDADVILFQATLGRIANLTLQQRGGGIWDAVDIARGRLTLEGCDISSEGRGCIAIHDEADPVVRNCRIRDGKESGIFVYENGQGTIEGNEIFANALAGIEIKTGGNPTCGEPHS